MTDMLAAQLFVVPRLDALGSQWDAKVLKSCFKKNVKFSATDGMARMSNCGSSQSCRGRHITFFLQEASALPRASCEDNILGAIESPSLS